VGYNGAWLLLCGFICSSTRGKKARSNEEDNRRCRP